MPSILDRPVTPAIVNDTLAVPSDFPPLSDGTKKILKQFKVKDLENYEDSVNDWWTKTKKALIGLNLDVATTADATAAVSRNIKISANGFTAGITEERIARINADGALASIINTVSVSYQAADATLAASVVTEQTARVTADLALASLITTLTASVDTNVATLTAQIITEQNARATADDAIASILTTLTATVTDNLTTVNASIANEATVRSTADTAIAATVTTLTATVSTNLATVNASISAEATARATADSAITGTLTTLTATVTSNNSTLTASISSEASARATADSALSTRIDTLSASAGIHTFTGSSTPTASGVGDIWYKTGSGIVHVYRWDGSTWIDTMGTDIDSINAAVITEQSARITADGHLSAKYTLSVIAGNIVTGMNITSSTDGGTDVSSIIFQAANFQIYNGSAGVAPFQVSGGVVRITGSLVITAADVGAIATGGAAADINTGSTTISGGKITTGTVTLGQLNFTPATSSTIVGTINASTEGILISGSKIQIDGSVTFTSGYDPTTKITTGGAAGDVNANSTTIAGGKITAGSINASQVGANLLITNAANIQDAVITSAKITALEANKILAGTMFVSIEFTSAKITGGIISTIATRFNTANPTNEMPFVAYIYADLVAEHGGPIAVSDTSTSGTYFPSSNLSFTGWGTGSTGLQTNRFGLSDMFFIATMQGNGNVPTGRMGYDLAYNINGGAWNTITGHNVIDNTAFGNISMTTGFIIPSLSGTDTINFAALIDHSSGAAGPGIGGLFVSVAAFNG